MHSDDLTGTDLALIDYATEAGGKSTAKTNVEVNENKYRFVTSCCCVAFYSMTFDSVGQVLIP